MKTVLLLVFTLFIASVQGQGTLDISPIPVTNGLTGTLADSSIVAALYYGSAGAPESSLVLLPSASPLVGGFATFGSPTIIPSLPPGSSAMLQVRAWSSGYPSYEAAVGSGLPSVLVGKSLVLMATLASGPPPIPTPLIFPGFTVQPVPEPACGALFLLGVSLLRLWRSKSCVREVLARPRRGD